MYQIQSFFAVFVSFSIFVLLAGCGGSSQPEPMPENNRVQENLAERTGLNKNLNQEQNQGQDEQKAAPKKKKKRAKKQETENSPEPPKMEVPEVQLPANSAAWTLQEFAYIRGSKPDLFPAAVSELAKRLKNPAAEEDSAKMLSQFLASVIPGALAKEEALLAAEPRVKEAQEALENLNQDDGKNRKNSSGVEMKRTQDMVFYQIPQNVLRDGTAALVSSSSETAVKQMAAFLAGVLQFDDNKVALEAAMDAYAKKARDGKLSQEEESLLLAFLLTPDLAVNQAAEAGGVQAPEVKETEYDENGNPIVNNNQTRTSSHPQILVSPGQNVQFKFQGGNGSITTFTPADVQKAVLNKFCPASSPLFRARAARALAGSEVMAAADTPAKQAFLVQEVLQKFLLKKEFANTIAHILMYKQTDLDETLRASLEENLLLSCRLLTQYHYSLLDEKTTEEYRTALKAKRSQMEEDDAAREEAEESASQKNSAPVAPRSLLSQSGTSVSAGNNVQNVSNASRNPTSYSPMVELLLNPEERKALEEELWTPEMRSLLFENLSQSFGSYIDEGMANLPEPGSTARPKVPQLPKSALQAIEMYLQIPSMETRLQLYTLLDRGWLLGPEVFRQTLFDRIETEPGFLMVVKSLDRRALPKVKEKKQPTRKVNNSRKRTNSKVKQREPSAGALMREKRMQVGAAWLDQSYNLTCQWCWKFSRAAAAKRSLASAERILDRNAPKSAVPEIPEGLRQQFPFPRDSEVVSCYTSSDPVIGSMTEKDGMKITFFEVRCSAMLTKLVSTLKSKNPHMLERGILTKNPGQNAVANAHWLERFEVNRDTGKCESIDVLIAPPASANNRNQNPSYDNREEDSRKAKGPENFVVYVLIMGMDDLTGEHVSNLKGDDDDFVGSRGDDDDDDDDSGDDDDYGGEEDANMEENGGAEEYGEASEEPVP